MRLLFEHTLKEKDKEKAAAVAAATNASSCQQSPPSNPELSSLIDYLNKYNYSSIYGPASNFIFLWNVCTNQIPPHSSFWHPQSLKCSVSSALGQWVGKEVGSQIQGQPVGLGICKNDSRFTFFLLLSQSYAPPNKAASNQQITKEKKVKLESIF